MTRTLQGMAFTVHSPSLYELAVIDDVGDPGARVFLKYGGQHRWHLVYCSGAGHRIERCFPSLAAAIGLIAERRAAG